MFDKNTFRNYGVGGELQIKLPWEADRVLRSETANESSLTTFAVFDHFQQFPPV